MTERRRSPLTAVLGGIGMAAGAWIAYSRFVVNHHAALPPAVDAERIRFRDERAGFLSYYADSSAAGRPLALIHSVNAAASAYEMRPIFESYRSKRPVYALDLPGFGFSERADRVYSPDLYAAAINAFLERVASTDDPADVVALSLGSEFAARAALSRPELFRSLTLISPSGLYRRESRNVNQRAEGEGWSDGARVVFRFPLWSQAFYDLLTTRASIRWFLQQSFVGDPHPGLVDYDYATAHQPGARFAPISFVSGKLFTPDALSSLYMKLTPSIPVLVLYDRDSFVRFDALPDLLRDRPNWRAQKIAPTLGLPQFERMEAVASVLGSFWAE